MGKNRGAQISYPGIHMWNMPTCSGVVLIMKWNEEGVVLQGIVQSPPLRLNRDAWSMVE